MNLRSSEVVRNRHLEHLVQIAALPALWVATSNNDDGSLLHFGLVHRGFAQSFLLLGILHNHKAPGLKIVSAGSLQACPQNGSKVFDG